MKHIFSLAFVLTIANMSFAQRYWTDPSPVTDPSSPVDIYVDLAAGYNGVAATACGNNMDTVAISPLYIWAWGASGVPGGDWGSYPDRSDLRWMRLGEVTTGPNAGTNVYKFTMTPTLFYNKTESEIFDNDINFLIRKKTVVSAACTDGDQTADFKIRVDPPYVPTFKVRTYPRNVDAYNTVVMKKDDAFTIIYDPSTETAREVKFHDTLFVYVQATGSNGTVYRYVDNGTPITSVGNANTRFVEALRMKKGTDGIFTLKFFPDTFLNIPTGVNITNMKVKIVARPWPGERLIAQSQIAEALNDYDWDYTVACP